MTAYELTPGAGAQLPAIPPELRGAVADFLDASLSRNTRKNYRSAWRVFVRWCASKSLTPLPAAPETVAAYCADRARKGIAPRSITANMAAVAQAHSLAGLDSPLESPLVRRTLKGIRRELGRPPRKRKPLSVGQLARAVAQLPEDTAGLRDRALLLVGFAGALRRSELVALTLADVQITPRGAVVWLSVSKTDQERQGAHVAIPRAAGAVCPVAALERWVDHLRGLVSREEASVPLFPRIKKSGCPGRRLKTDDVADLVQRAAAELGLDPSQYGGHSLRAGMATAAHERKRPLLEIMRQGRWKNPRVASGYVHLGALFDDNPVEGMFD